MTDGEREIDNALRAEAAVDQAIWDRMDDLDALMDDEEEADDARP